ncbi:MAG: V-type ATP synthase subunit E [Oscillospiraceae bacterium]
MTGLEKILAEIKNEAAAEAQQTLEKAKEEADGILAQAKAVRDEQTGHIAASAAQDVADIERSRESAMALQRRQRTLATKQALLEETKQMALDRLYALDDAAYFELLVKLAGKAAQPGAGVMLLSEKDQKRMPADFEKKLAAALPAGAAVSISKESRPFDGGFVLQYGEVEENCTFKAMFDARGDAFSDLISEVLFA